MSLINKGNAETNQLIQTKQHALTPEPTDKNPEQILKALQSSARL